MAAPQLVQPAAAAAGAAPFPVGRHFDFSLQLPGGEGPEAVAAQVYAYDAGSDRLVLRQPGSTPFHSTLRIVKGAAVAGAAPREGAGSEAAIEALPPVDLARGREREEKAVRAAEAEAAKIGVGVSRLAQATFDSLAKTLPCRWEGDKIVVLDEIVVAPPYETCTSLHGDDAAALRVKKVLDSERKRLQATT